MNTLLSCIYSKSLIAGWRSCRQMLTWIYFLQFRTDIARTEYLSNADERLRWQASSLPADDLCTENAIMLKRFNRYFILRFGMLKRYSQSSQGLAPIAALSKHSFIVVKCYVCESCSTISKQKIISLCLPFFCYA